MRMLLKWAETETSTILPSTLHAKATKTGTMDIAEVNETIRTAIKEIMDDSYIHKVGTCFLQGFEL